MSRVVGRVKLSRPSDRQWRFAASRDGPGPIPRVERSNVEIPHGILRGGCRTSCKAQHALPLPQSWWFFHTLKEAIRLGSLWLAFGAQTERRTDECPFWGSTRSHETEGILRQRQATATGCIMHGVRVHIIPARLSMGVVFVLLSLWANVMTTTNMMMIKQVRWWACSKVVPCTNRKLLKLQVQTWKALQKTEPPKRPFPGLAHLTTRYRCTKDRSP